MSLPTNVLPPGVSPGRPIDQNTFHRLPRLPGWTYETHEGVLNVRPDHTVQVVRIRTSVEPSGAQTAHGEPSLRIVPWGDVRHESLLNAVDESFADSVHFWGWSDDERRASLADDLSRGGRAGSVVAVAESGSPAGALLTALGSDGPFVHLLCVTPTRRRRGVANAMMAAALRDLQTAGFEHVHSSYLLASVESALWHYALGFEDIPTPAATASRLRAVRWELARTPAVPDDLIVAARRALRAAGADMGAKEDVLERIVPR